MLIMLNKIVIISLMLFFVLGISSCKSVYPRPEFANFANSPDPVKVMMDFRKNNIQACSLYQTAIIEVKGKSIASIGFCSFDAENGNIALSLMSTTGMKFVEIAEINGKKSAILTLPDVAFKQKAIQGISEDIKRIYIQPKGIPEDFLETDRSLSFNWVNGDLRTELIFGQSPKKDIKGLLLLTKKIYLKDLLDSVVFYYDYKKINDKLMPMRIRYENDKYDYNLILKTKEVSHGKKSDKR